MIWRNSLGGIILVISANLTMGGTEQHALKRLEDFAAGAADVAVTRATTRTGPEPPLRSLIDCTGNTSESLAITGSFSYSTPKSSKAAFAAVF